MERLTHEADFGLEEWEQTLYSVNSDQGGAYNILDIANHEGEEEFDEILKTISLGLKHYEDTGLTPERIMELKEAVQRLDKIFGDEITVDQVIDFFVDFYIAQGDDERVEAAELLTNEEVERYKRLKERDTAKAAIITGYNRAIGCKVGECPKCGTMTRDYMNFCSDCGQRLRWEEQEDV